MPKKPEKKRAPEFQNIELSQLRADALIIDEEPASHAAFQSRILLAIATALDSIAFSTREKMKMDQETHAAQKRIFKLLSDLESSGAIARVFEQAGAPLPPLELVFSDPRKPRKL